MTYAPELTAAFGAGLLGSLHCIGMCGPLAALGCRAQSLRHKAWGPFLFLLGKLAGYSLLGALAGFFGAVLINTGLVGRGAAWISLAGGALMLLVLALSRFHVAPNTATSLTVRLSRLSLKAGKSAGLFLGIAAAFLPCGLLYAAVAWSATAGETIKGMAIMQAFGLGTSPALFGAGLILGMIPQKWSRYGTIAGEIVLAISALALIWRGYMGLTAVVTGHSCCH
jgi:sulfite exporter TauE/SafE